MKKIINVTSNKTTDRSHSIPISIDIFSTATFFVYCLACKTCVVCVIGSSHWFSDICMQSSELVKSSKMALINSVSISCPGTYDAHVLTLNQRTTRKKNLQMTKNISRSIGIFMTKKNRYLICTEIEFINQFANCFIELDNDWLYVAISVLATWKLRCSHILALMRTSNVQPGIQRL